MRETCATQTFNCSLHRNMETLFSKMYKKSRELFTHGEIRNILTKESNTALCFLGKKKKKRKPCSPFFLKAAMPTPITRNTFRLVLGLKFRLVASQLLKSCFFSSIP